MNLKELRKSQGLTQAEVATEINVALSTYRGYENETSEPSIQTLIKLANYFDVSLDYLLGRAWNNQIGYIPDNAKDVVKMLLTLDENELERTKAYVTAQIESKGVGVTLRG